MPENITFLQKPPSRGTYSALEELQQWDLVVGGHQSPSSDDDDVTACLSASFSPFSFLFPYVSQQRPPQLNEHQRLGRLISNKHKAYQRCPAPLQMIFICFLVILHLSSDHLKSRALGGTVILVV
jgi:hypothetical protein